MPYIKQEDRKTLLDLLLRIDLVRELSDGDLNYIITKLCLKYIEQKGLKYTHLNSVVGVLESAKMEFYRRIVGPYENSKIDENGDVYPN